LRGYRDQDLAAQGLPLEPDYIACYCESTGMDCASLLKDWPFYLAFNLFRLSAILQGIGHREREGTASSASAREIALMSAPVARWGWAIAQGREPEQTVLA
jgi:aminoglycoside phosphotransferase (APT) family kinase protein